MGDDADIDIALPRLAFAFLNRGMNAGGEALHADRLHLGAYDRILDEFAPLGVVEVGAGDEDLVCFSLPAHSGPFSWSAGNRTANAMQWNTGIGWQTPSRIPLKRKWKLDLIEQTNPGWRDLYPELL